MSARLRLSFGLIGLVALPSVAAADGLFVPGISPELPQPRPGYRESYNDFPPGRYGGGLFEYVLSGAQTSLHGPLYSSGGVPAPVAPAYAAPAYAAPAYNAPAYTAPAQQVYAPSPLRGGLPHGGLPEYAPDQPQAYYGGRTAYRAQAYTSQAYTSQAYAGQAYTSQAPQGALPFAQPVAQPVMYGAPGASYDPLRADPSLAARPINPIYNRQMIAYAGGARPGTILIDTTNKFLYLVQPGAQAIRYGIGVGRPGFVWTGTKVITRKAEWPDWTPPKEMLARRPDLPHHMVGGEANPLGARALYLGTSEYRIHGTNEPYTIGTNVSSGCIRMMNQDVMDLYRRVGVGTRVVVM